MIIIFIFEICSNYIFIFANNLLNLLKTDKSI